MQLGPTQSEPISDPGAVALDHHVGLIEQATEDLPALLRSQIQSHRPLPPIEQPILGGDLTPAMPS